MPLSVFSLWIRSRKFAAFSNSRFFADSNIVFSSSLICFHTSLPSSSLGKALPLDALPFLRPTLAPGIRSLSSISPTFFLMPLGVMP